MYCCECEAVLEKFRYVNDGWVVRWILLGSFIMHWLGNPMGTSHGA